MNPMHMLQLLFAPKSAFEAIAREPDSLPRTILMHLMPIAVLPAIAWYYGVTVAGWTVGSFSDHPLRISVESATPIIILFYLAMIGGTLFIGGMIHWMSVTYEATSTPARAIKLATYTATPLFLAGIIGFAPVLWLDMLIGVVAGCYTIYLLYLGIPRVMHVSEERGYLFASAALGVGFIGCIILMGATVVLWEFGFMPEFTD